MRSDDPIQILAKTKKQIITRHIETANIQDHQNYDEIKKGLMLSYDELANPFFMEELY